MTLRVEDLVGKTVLKAEGVRSWDDYEYHKIKLTFTDLTTLEVELRGWESELSLGVDIEGVENPGRRALTIGVT